MDDSSSISQLDHLVVLAGVAVVGVGASAILAAQNPSPSWELRLSEWINDAPDAVATVLWPVMQLGTIFAPVLVAIIIVLVAGDVPKALAALSAGVASWFIAKGVKNVFERGRPLEFLPEIDVREGEGTGLGFVSGHSAVVAACAVCVAAAVPRQWRPIVAVVAGLAGVSRIIYGVHLPADVVGGWSLGALVGLSALWIAGAVESDRPVRATA